MGDAKSTVELGKIVEYSKKLEENEENPANFLEPKMFKVQSYLYSLFKNKLKYRKITFRYRLYYILYLWISQEIQSSILTFLHFPQAKKNKTKIQIP